MPWDRSQPTDPKYATPEHRAQLAEYKRLLDRDGYLICAAIRCLFPTRYITNPNGREPDGLTAGHADDGTTYRGPEHRRCNSRDGSVRARARQAPPKRWDF